MYDVFWAQGICSFKVVEFATHLVLQEIGDFCQHRQHHLYAYNKTSNYELQWLDHKSLWSCLLVLVPSTLSTQQFPVSEVSLWFSFRTDQFSNDCSNCFFLWCCVKISSLKLHLYSELGSQKNTSSIFCRLAYSSCSELCNSRSTRAKSALISYLLEWMPLLHYLTPPPLWC